MQVSCILGFSMPATTAWIAWCCVRISGSLSTPGRLPHVVGATDGVGRGTE
jgi:hypothetical protein